MPLTFDEGLCLTLMPQQVPAVPSISYHITTLVTFASLSQTIGDPKKRKKEIHRKFENKHAGSTGITFWGPKKVVPKGN